MDATSPSLLHDTPLESERAPIHPLAATLIARNAENLARFYEEKLGFARLGQSGDRIRLGAGPVGFLDILHRPAAKPHSGRGSGLFHIAFLLPDRAALGRWFIAARAAGAPFDGASDHAVSEAFYLSDPEGNGIEVYADRPRDEWPRRDGGVNMTTERMDVEGVISAGAVAEAHRGFPPEARIGHVHLRVGDINAVRSFYVDQLGLQEMDRRPGGVFYSAGGYHHHIATNQWQSAGAPARSSGMTGLAEVEIRVSDKAVMAAFQARSKADADGLIRLKDPAGLAFAISSPSP